MNQNNTLLPLVVNDALVWIENNIHQPFRIDDIIKRTGYSKWHFLRYFKVMTGMPLARYIRLRRLTIAARKLKSTVLTVTDIYYSVGFVDPSIFCRTFHRHFGLSPTEYRLSASDQPAAPQKSRSFICGQVLYLNKKGMISLSFSQK